MQGILSISGKFKWQVCCIVALVSRHCILDNLNTFHLIIPCSSSIRDGRWCFGRNVGPILITGEFLFSFINVKIQNCVVFPLYTSDETE